MDPAPAASLSRARRAERADGSPMPARLWVNPARPCDSHMILPAWPPEARPGTAVHWSACVTYRGRPSNCAAPGATAAGALWYRSAPPVGPASPVRTHILPDQVRTFGSNSGCGSHPHACQEQVVKGQQHVPDSDVSHLAVAFCEKLPP
ncbi:hypothetical protein GUJ93_ZPchr0007g5957 [Zizania palustris]|uniref:Uncharacterized protein n=1 Tax=Zizania palustris TaxID=103762 RepID=A0A8J5TG65_ZIZPA|nr:hypothetical protein GUJ93_ZPchr0007g5957 [Zizania palustris]